MTRALKPKPRPLFAAGTTVTVASSRAEIEALLKKYEATDVKSLVEEHRATIVFSRLGRHVRFVLPLPRENDERFTKDHRGRSRPPRAAVSIYNAETRRVWRALALVLKGKLEAAESGISSFESEFLAFIVLQGGKTVADVIVPQLDSAHSRGGSLPLLLGPGGRS